MIGEKGRKKALIAIFITFGISTLATTILFPVLAQIFLAKQDSFMMKGINEGYQGLMLGLFLASFPFAQFLIGPVMGDYSDKKGRRGIFLFSVLLESLGYVLCAISIHMGILWLLFVGRIVTGLAAGNTSVCLASVVDISSSEKEKIKYFGILSAVIGLMFILGPLLGGQVSGLFASPVYALAMPFWAGGVFALLNIFILLLFYHETNFDLCSHPFDVLKSFHNIQIALRTKELRNLYLIYFFFLFAWNMIYQLLPAFLVKDFQMTSVIVGVFGAVFGCIWICGTLLTQLLIRVVHKMHGIVFCSLLGVSVFAIMAGFSKQIMSFSIAIALIVFLSGSVWPIFTAAISKSSEQRGQGKALALSQSLQSFSMMCAPLLGGAFLNKNGMVPFLMTAISVLIAAVILIRSGKKPFTFL